MADTASVLVDCFSVVHMHLPLATSDACLSARAAIRAAEIQAKAARSSGTDTLIAGLAALGAGALTLAAALLEYKRKKSIDRFKQRAFVHKLFSLLAAAEKEIDSIDKYLRNVEESLSAEPVVPCNYNTIITTKCVEDTLALLSLENITTFHTTDAKILHVITPLDFKISFILNVYRDISHDAEYMHIICCGENNNARRLYYLSSAQNGRKAIETVKFWSEEVVKLFDREKN